MPQKKNRQIKSKQKDQKDILHLQVSREGLLPHPSILEKYNELAPDAVERILKLAEEEAKYRHAQEMAEMNAEIEQKEWRATERRLGQIFGLIIVLVSLGLSTWMIFRGHETPGIILSVTALLSIFLAAVAGRNKNPHRIKDSNPGDIPG